jgi:hypothetical protein
MCNNHSEITTENINSAVIQLSESVSKIVEEINVLASSEMLLTFAEFLRNIPKDIKDTEFYGKIEKLGRKNLYYEDVVWLVENFGLNYTEATWQKLSECEDAKSDLYRYIGKIVLSTSMEKREKLVVLLAHMEPLIYNALKISKAANIGPKQAVREVSEEKNEGMSVESLGKMYVFAITLIVFARTDSYTKKIDKRMPFRNNILHNGIVKYSDEDVDIAYELLVNFIEIIMRVKERLQG